MISRVFFFQAEDGIRDLVRSRGLGDVYKRQALEFVANRHWDDTWMARFSYTLSKSTGNYEGGVNSDTGNDIPGWTESGDDVMFINSNYGVLANDHRHQFKMYGAYAITPELTAGANMSILSGAPINARAYGNPVSYTHLTLPTKRIV
eukprot:TRINITY_DN27793_c0_g1_i1.p1 TRINITY_DN27793_c0_g1~~TRINITY_DN27793_c0_g1_i1.p1  ORF type:complete len:148 (+),score=17.13 TRINITY_DN27793_c0_g1_i1:24-467(+)